MFLSSGDTTATQHCSHNFTKLFRTSAWNGKKRLEILQISWDLGRLEWKQIPPMGKVELIFATAFGWDVLQYFPGKYARFFVCIFCIVLSAPTTICLVLALCGLQARWANVQCRLKQRYERPNNNKLHTHLCEIEENNKIQSLEQPIQKNHCSGKSINHPNRMPGVFEVQPSRVCLFPRWWVAQNKGLKSINIFASTVYVAAASLL